MTIFVDTSAFLAVLDSSDQYHAIAGQIWQRLVLEKVSLLCTNYVLLETIALVQNRLGMVAVKAFQDGMYPILDIEWADSSLHQASIAALLTANRRRLSLVDCSSFEAARRLGITTVFAFDQDFQEQGFTCLAQ